MAQSEWVKDPDAVLDYKFDWKALTNGTGSSDWLGATETITAAFTVAIVGGGGTGDLTIDSSSRTDTDTSVTVWLSAGIAGKEYGVRCRIVTDNAVPRKDDRTMMIKVEER
jgi:hypothetical protein